MKHIIPISGKDSLATAIIQKQRRPDLQYEYLFNPTGKELPETLEWIKKVEQYLGQEIVFVGVDMRTVDEWVNGYRPAVFARWCTRKCKIEPMEQYFDCEGTVYYGLRADEPERIGYINKGKSDLTPVYPLREVGFKIDNVIQLCNDIGLKPPAFRWEYLVLEFTKYLGADFLQQTFTEWQLDQLFAWRRRNNCYDCFNMAQYEWAGLSEHHPDIFWLSVEEEEKLHTKEKVFYTIPGLPLRELYLRRYEIVDKHIKRTVRQIEKLKQLTLFDKDSLFEDLLSTTSCGLLCGK